MNEARVGRALLLILLLSAALLHAQSRSEPADTRAALAGIKNFLQVNTEVCTGGQPTAEELGKLKAAGIRAIVNLRRPSEYDAAAEQAQARALGLRYFNIPVDRDALTDPQVEEFLRILADPANRPAFLHCSSANRVGAFWMIRRVLVDGWTVEEAEKEAERIGLSHAATRTFARDYLARQRQP